MQLGELVPCGGGDPIPLLKERLVVGRRSRCDITLGFSNVSNRHCELKLINGYWFVQDLNSSNGIKINGNRCERKWLMPEDELSIGKHRYQIFYQPTGDAPTDEDEDVFGTSLMEKAGLVKPKDSTAHLIAQMAERAETKPSESNGNGPSDPDDDEAMQWLMDD